jgi:DNA gyrase subunit A
VEDKRVEGIAHINDESDRDGMRIVIDIKRDANSNVVLNKLFKYTALQTSFSVNNIALVKGRPRMLNLKDLIHYFVEHRHDVVIRRTRFIGCKLKNGLNYSKFYDYSRLFGCCYSNHSRLENS